MNNRYDDQWEKLRNIQPSQIEKDALRERLWHSINNESVKNTPKKHYQWTALLASCLFILICGGVVWKVISEGAINLEGPRNADEQPIVSGAKFSWGLEGVQIKKTENGWDMILDKDLIKAGEISVITKDEMNNITTSLPMHVTENLENFPYPTTMNIEHVKMMGAVFRYHFFIPIEDEKLAHLTFDYPKLEHADIFQAIGTLKIAGIQSMEYKEQPYVKHGYGAMIFPVGLKPVSKSSNEEIYYWEIYGYKIVTGHFYKTWVFETFHVFES